MVMVVVVVVVAVVVVEVRDKVMGPGRRNPHSCPLQSQWGHAYELRNAGMQKAETNTVHVHGPPQYR